MTTDLATAHRFAAPSLRLVLVTFLALAMMSGQASTGRFVPFVSFDVGLKEMFLGVACLLFAVLSFMGRLTLRNPPLMFWVLVVLVGTTLSISMINGDGWSDSAVWDTAFVAVLSLLLYFSIRNTVEFDEFLLLVACISALVVLMDIVLRANSIGSIITNISVARINLIGIAAALTLISRQTAVFPSLIIVILLGYAVASNSLKMSLLSVVLFLGIVTTWFVITLSARQLAAMVLLAGGVVLAVVAGGNTHLQARFGALGSALPAVEQDELSVRQQQDELSARQQDEAVTSDGGGPSFEERATDEPPLATYLCSRTETYEYCVNDEINLRDSTERIRMWLYAYDLFLSNPMTGVGRSSYALSLFYDGDGRPRVITYGYPHNLAFEYLSMYGIVGFAALLIALVFSLIVYVRAAVEDSAYVVLAALAPALLLASMTGGTLYDIRYFFVFATVLSGLAQTALFRPFSKNETKRD